MRGGSKSIPLKNIKEFCGKPLVYWTVKALEDSKDIDKVVVATDSDDIKKCVESFNFPKTHVYDRDPANAQDKSSTESVIIEYISKAKLPDEDNFVLVQATSPLLEVTDIDKGFELYKNGSYDSVLSCVRSMRFFWHEDGSTVNYDFMNRPRRQDFNGILMENGAFYINSVRNILESKNRLSGKIGISEMPEYAAVEIDEEDDWIIAEKLMYRHVLKKNKDFKNIKLFLSDVDGVMTDAGMYYTESGDELKKFNTHDGKGFELLRNAGIKIGIITSENTRIVERRAEKLKVDYLYQGKEFGGKLEAAKAICEKEGITLDQVAYIGDDINCYDLLNSVGYAACPQNALNKIKEIPNIINLTLNGGEGVIREFIEGYILI